MLNSSFRILIVSLAVVGIIDAFVPCIFDPKNDVGHWIGRDQECAALVQTRCQGVGHTSTWRKGIKVQDNCKIIPKFTAIATFLGPDGGYNDPIGHHQHTAIFVECTPGGIGVYDQWNGTPIKYRLIPWTNVHSSQYTGSNYWTIA